MPLCYCFTSQPSDKIPETFEKDFSEHVAKVLKKPVERVSVILNAGARICNGGTSDTAFIVQIHSIAVFDEARNPGYYPQFFDFLTESLGIPANRMKIQLIDIAAYSAKNGE